MDGDDIRFAIVDPQRLLLAELADQRMTQRDIALSYALALNTPDDVDWPTVNQAIIARWSLSGLKRVKDMAWRARR